MSEGRVWYVVYETRTCWRIKGGGVGSEGWGGRQSFTDASFLTEHPMTWLIRQKENADTSYELYEKEKTFGERDWWLDYRVLFWAEIDDVHARRRVLGYMGREGEL